MSYYGKTFNLKQDYITANGYFGVRHMAYNCADECMVFSIGCQNFHDDYLSIKYTVEEIALTTPDGYTETITPYAELCLLTHFADKQVQYRVYNKSFKKFYITPWCIKNNPYPERQCCSQISLKISAQDTRHDIDSAMWVLDALDADIQGSFGEEIDEYDDGYTVHNSTSRIPSFSEFVCKNTMKAYGYTISRTANLSDEERQDILTYLIESNKVSKADVLQVLSDFIEARLNVPQYVDAIIKWKTDLAVIRRFIP